MQKQKLVAATNNVHKLKEIKSILKDNYEVLSLSDCGIDIEIEETGETFLENALIKAREVNKITGLPSIADDSGLIVDALNGLPGVHSARFAGEPCNDNNNNLKLIKMLEGKTERTARYASVVVICFSFDDYIYAEGFAEGIILESPSGSGGFGYDPYFYSLDLKKTFAEISIDEKNTISHRGKAILQLVAKFN